MASFAERRPLVRLSFEKSRKALDRHWKLTASTILLSSLVPTAYASNLLDNTSNTRGKTQEVSVADIAKATGSIVFAVTEYTAGAAIILSKKLGKE